MKNLNEFVQHAEKLVKYKIVSINKKNQSLLSVEEEILELLHATGSLIESMILDGIEEPTQENRILINGQEAYYKGQSNLSFKDRFGHKQKISRRAYKVASQEGYNYPLDHKIGMNRCRRHSPLLSFLISSYGANESYTCASNLLSATLGFQVSATAIQNNAERIGASLPENPLYSIPDEKLNQECELMIVEIDGTMSPQIPEIEGLNGRESLKVPTEYKECNVVAIEKYQNGIKQDRWVGADYGKRSFFEEYFRKTTLKMGFLKAKETVFIADGAKHNWEICRTHLPGAVEILDFYHAIEHLSSFCTLLQKTENERENYFKTWRGMILEGDILQVLDEMKNAKAFANNADEAQKEINYLNNNKNRMAYDEYRERDWPIGSGLVEGQCKLIVNKRFKRNGMRWKLKDNRAILKLRLAFLNSTLHSCFLPKPLKIDFWEKQNEFLSTRVA
jgi:hypothetical protein